MISRREVALGGLLTIGWLAAPCACQAAHSDPRRFGCWLSPEEADQLLGSRPASPLDAPRYLSSGNRDLDFALAQTLSRLTDIWNVLPAFCYFDEPGAANAHATDKQLYSRADGTVLFGRRLLDLCLKQPESPDAVIAAACAHEFGHIVQYKYGLQRKILAGQRTVKRNELHADFLSGYFAGRRKLERPDFPAAVFAVASYNHGDYVFNNVNHHGRPDERATAVIRGFETAFRDRRSPAEAIQIGMKYVATL